MGRFADLGTEWRNYVTDGVSGSGNNPPNKGNIRTILNAMDANGMLLKGDLTYYSSWSAPNTGVFRTDFQLELQNSDNTHHAGLSFGNNYPVEQEIGIGGFSYLSSGAAFQLFGQFAGFTSTANTPSDSVRNNNVTNSDTYVAWHLLGQVGGSPNDVTPLILRSNHSVTALPGSTGSLPWHGDPPAVSWWDNHSNEMVRGILFAGTAGIGTTGNLTSGSAVMSGLSINPTSTGVVAGMQISGPGIKPRTTVVSFDATTITLSQTAFANESAQAYQLVSYAQRSGFTFEHQGGGARIGAATWGGVAVEVGVISGVPFFQSYNRNTLAAGDLTTLVGLWTITGKVALATSASPTSSGTGVAGQLAWDSSFLYVCTATNTWKRVGVTGGY